MTDEIKKPAKTMTVPDNSTYANLYEISPTDMRAILNYGQNYRIQSLIDLLLKLDSHFLGKYQDRLSVIKKSQKSWKPASEDKKDVDIMEFIKSNLDPILTNANLKYLLSSLFRRFAVLEIVWNFDGKNYIVKELKQLPFSSFEFSKIF